MESPEDLTAFLRRMSGTPFVWGTSDCGCMLGAWVAQRRGRDPTAPLRGRYATARGARRAIARLGGFEEAGDALLGAVGLVRTDAPRAGDVGLVDHPVVGPAFAVKAALGWAVKSPRGVALGRWSIIAAWTV